MSPSRADGFGRVCLGCARGEKTGSCLFSAVQGLIQAVQSEPTAVGRVGARGAAGVGAVGGGGMFGRVRVGLQG